MSSSLQSTVGSLVLNNYASVFGAVLVGYDYILTLSREIHYVWRRRWTGVSTIFVLVRYPGLCWAMLNALIGTSFIPGPVEMYVSESPGKAALLILNRCNILFLVSCWTFPVFICAADLVMILRVHAMWNRSRVVLYSLLFIFAVQIIVSVVLPAIYNSSITYFTPATEQVLNFSFCVGTFSPSVPTLLGLYAALPRFVLSAMLLGLAVARTVKQLTDMYNATKRWQPNRYLNQFARDGTYYFVINTLYNIITVTASVAPSTDSETVITLILGTIATSLLCTAMPRFIIEVREMYDQDIRGRWQGIDTGFGAMSQNAIHDVGMMSKIEFVGSAPESQTEELDMNGSGVIQLNDFREEAHRV